MNKLELLEREIDAIVRSTRSNIVITDGEGILLRASPNCLSIYGKSADELIGRSVYDLEKEGVFSPSITIRVLKEKKEMQTMQHTQTNRVAMATGVPIFDDRGNLIRVISFSYDLTELEQLRGQYQNLQDQMKRYQTEIEGLRQKNTRVEGIVIQSKIMQQLWDLIHRVALSDATILLTGESGVGKSLYARTIHQASERKDHPFIEVNCGSIPESLFESELFGYEPGSFTGAHKNGKAGLIEIADKGTLFLDEIGEIPLSMQAKLLKVIQEKKVTRVGGVQSRHVDFRLISATNRNLEEMVEKGHFRKDLFFRINVIPIEIPPLRRRQDDISMLVQNCLRTLNHKYGVKKQIDPRSMDRFLQYDWPGNVRELENVMERLVLTVNEPVITPGSLPENIRTATSDRIYSNRDTAKDIDFTLKCQLEKVEKHWLQKALEVCRTTYEIAEYLGISQPSVVRKLKKYGLGTSFDS